MNKLCHLLSAALLFVLALASAALCSAQAPGSLGLVVDADVVPPEALQRALEAELAIPVRLGAPAESTLRVHKGASGQVAVKFSGPGTPPVERTVQLVEDEAEAVETLALLASNLVRDEAAGILSTLTRTTQSAQTTQHVAVPAASSPPDVRTFSCAAADVPFGFDFLPYLGTSSLAWGRESVRAFSFNLLGGLARGLKGFEIAGALNLEREMACGVQIAGAANVVGGPVRGAQVALVNVAFGPVQGASLGVLNMATYALTGTQFGVVNLTGKDAIGLQLSTLNVTGGALTGAQIGVANSAGSEVQGAQIGVANLALGRVWGAQLGVANLALDDLQGLSLGAVNLQTGAIEGAQLGVMNIATGELRGVQLGLVNYSERADAPVGLLSIVRRGETSLELWAPSETGVFTGGVTHGGRILHNLYQVGMRVGPEGRRYVFGVGLGGRVYTHRFLRIDVDAVMQHLIREFDADVFTLLPVVRVPFTFALGRGVGVMVAPSYQFMISRDPAERTQAHLGKSVHREGRTDITSWPGIAVGLRFTLSEAK